MLVHFVGFFCPDIVSSEYLKHLQEQIKFETLKLNNLKKTQKNLISEQNKYYVNLPWIYLITPTYARSVQKAELTRLSHTFLHVKNLHWIIIEDADIKTTLISNFLRKLKLPYTHLNIKTPPDYKMKHNDPNWLKPRGVLQRNKGLEWIRNNLNKHKNKGVLYFADDDNTYDLKIFDEVYSYFLTIHFKIK